MKYGIAVVLMVGIAMVISCEMETPTLVRDNPNDGRNPNVKPEIVSVTIGFGNGYATNPVDVCLETKLVSEVRIGFVENEGDELIADWQSVDTLFTLPISGTDGEKWLGCQVKAENQNSSMIHYQLFVLDTHCDKDTFYWTSNAEDTLNLGDTLRIYLEMQDDYIGPETGGDARVNLGDMLQNYILNEIQSGEYHTDYVVQDQDEVNNGVLNLAFTDRAGNVLPMIAASAPVNIIGEITLEFEKTFGGGSYDEGSSVHQTSDGGYVVAGFTNSYGAGSDDVYLIKTDGSGNLVWTQTFGESAIDKGNSVQQTSDGGYVIAGYTASYGAGSNDVYLIKTDGSGNPVWTQTFGGSDYDHASSVQQTSDGGYIVAGWTSSYGAGSGDVYLIKTDGSGNPDWTQTFGGSSNDGGSSVQQTLDGGYIVAGFTESYGVGYSDVYLIKTDGSGNPVWAQTFGGSWYDYGYSVQQTLDGGYIVAGTTASYGAGADDVYLIKTDGSGNPVWTQTFGGSGVDRGRSVQQTSDGGYIVAGGTSSYGVGSADVYLIKTDGSGNPVWTQTFGGSDYDQGSSVQQISDGGYIVAGGTVSNGAGSMDVYLIKTKKVN